MKNSTEFFIVHCSKYLGVALLAGSVVHWGTLGGNNLKYIGFFLVGLILIFLGTFLESAFTKISLSLKVVLLSVFLAIGTGMMSGGIQHYTDNMNYSALLIAIGIVITFFSIQFKDYKEQLNTKQMILMLVFAIFLFVVLNNIIPTLTDSTHSVPHAH